ncbi:orc1/cdc6 family replication initiation protein [Caldisphaera lagunensis DSM 15908]|uniref:ORC1-type DNA replication protein n=1 Tax=Caldisphaera lagunensis (strain DSM 15908 / JCM 11604 / ANMR 0165 / IC-154) TaxID=1056495 RepID=L0A965_CALLD|nr:AAA family ATPase [Caldisphaera lagunensis]AFZ70411.1 orc1/cdc6 family replication initiation protein [Caldisphaera lagunensis DSM 15908]
MSGKIFTNRGVFDETYIPSTLLVRDSEANVLITRYLSRLGEGSGSTDVTVLYGSIGKVGIGKTTLAKYVSRVLSKKAEDKGINFKPVYINVYGASSLHQILSRIVSELEMNIPVRGNATIEVLKAISDFLYIKDAYALIILDEFQSLLMSSKLSDDEFYLLLRVYEEIPPKDNINRLNFMLVSQDFRILSYMKERIPQVESQIGFRVHLRPYSSDELKTIIEQRAIEGLYENSYNQDILNMIADYYGYNDIKGGEGSARKAILTLRMAAEIADAENSGRIEERHVREALSTNAVSNIPLDIIRALSLHELLILQSISNLLVAKGGWLTSGEVEDEYSHLSYAYGEEPRKHTQFYEYIKNLNNMGLIESKISGKGIRGKTTIIRLPLDIPAERLKEVLESILLDRIGGPKPEQGN